MAAPSGAALLDVWERAAGLGHPERAVAYAGAAMPAWSPADISALPVGHRDAAVAGLRASAFGRRLAATAACPRCGETVEFELDVAALLPPAGDALPGPVDVVVDDWLVTCRVPTTLDLIATRATARDGESLAARCVNRITHAGVEIGDALPAPLVEAIGEALGRADPAADVRLELACVHCGLAWAVPFDIVSVVDRELDAWARATLEDVATLARAFGWTEAEVLGLSMARRRRYLELASA